MNRKQAYAIFIEEFYKDKYNLARVRDNDFINNNVEVTGTKLTAEGILAEGYLPNPAIKP